MRSLEKIDQQLVAAVCHNVTIGYTVRESAGVRAKIYYLIAKLNSLAEAAVTEQVGSGSFSNSLTRVEIMPKE